MSTLYTNKELDPYPLLREFNNKPWRLYSSCCEKQLLEVLRELKEIEMDDALIGMLAIDELLLRL